MEKVPSEVAYDRWHRCEQFTNLSQIRGVLPDKALAEFFSFFLGEKKDVSGALQKQNARPFVEEIFHLLLCPPKTLEIFCQWFTDFILCVKTLMGIHIDLLLP
jgi:hypothetical protein